MIGRLENDSGFSFIELLVVVAIIGILASLAISNYGMFKTNALAATAASDARGLAPGADFVSTEATGTTVYPLNPGGGEVLGIPGGRSSPNTVGTVEIRQNSYTIKTYQVAPDICFTLEDGAMSASSGPCT